MASRWATPDELIALSEETGQHEGTTLEGIVPGCLDQFADDEIELLGRMSAAANRPMNWNVLTVDGREPDRVPRQLQAADRAARARRPGRRADDAGAGADEHELPQLLRDLADPRVGSDVLGVPVPERIERLRDPDTRLQMLERSQSPEAGVFRRLADWGDYVIGDTYAPENEGLQRPGRARHRRRARALERSARCSTS